MFYSSLERSFLISSNPFPEFTATTWAMTIAGLVIFVGTTLYVFRRLKQAAKEEPYPGPHEILSQFRDMRDEGIISEEEFRRIKLLLADKIAGEDKDEKNGDKENINVDKLISGGDKVISLFDKVVHKR